MAGRRLCSDDEAVLRGFSGQATAIRRRVLRETVEAFEHCDPPDRFHRLAAGNLARWRTGAAPAGPGLRVEVVPSDWGELALGLTRECGVCFAVLNMANPDVPGGAYVEGAPAQEENLFRRTDCHFRVGPDEYDPAHDRYRPEIKRLLTAADGLVHLDVDRPRVCVRGPEVRSRGDLGYAWLAEDQVFPFFELRAAAQDLRDGSPFDPDDARRRIEAQLETLRRHRVRHAVLGAFGCGAFGNPAREVARIYREAIGERTSSFDRIAFAIHHPGYGPDNFTPFQEVFHGS